jgi:hypothetical protein
MARPWLTLAAVATLFACAEDAAPFATGRRDAGADAGGPGPDATTAQPSDASNASLLPQVVSAEHDPERRTRLECVDVPGVTGFYTPPSLHAVGDRVYVASVDSTDVTPRVLLHAAPIDALEFGEPTTLLYGARPVDLIAEGQTLRALAGRQFYTVELLSTDGGATFSEPLTLGPHEPTYNCDGYPPPRYFRGREPVQLAVVGSDFNTGVFGCYERLFVARAGDAGWTEPVEVERGDAVFAFQGQQRAWIVTTLATLRSDDDARTWSPEPSLDPVAGGVFTGAQLALARWDATGALVLESDDDGLSWHSQTRVIEGQAPGGVFIANDGASVSLAAAMATELVFSTRFETDGAWSEPTRIEHGGARRLLALAQSGATTLWLTAGGDDALELCSLR